MILNLIKQSDITEKPLYYSRWHSISTPEEGLHYDINVGGMVGPILSVSDTLYIVTTYLMDIIELDNNYREVNGFKIWDININNIYLEDSNGIRYRGTYESFNDTKNGLEPNGTSCLFSDNYEESVIESFFMIRDLLPKKTDPYNMDKDFTSVRNHIKTLEPIIKEICPEKFI